MDTTDCRENCLVRIISEDGGILGLACDTTALVEEARRLHEASEAATAALGRALTGGALMAVLLKRDQRLAIKIEGNGPLRKIIVEADSDGAVRGFVGDPTVVLPPRGEKIDVAGAVGKEGFLTVIKDLGAKEPYSGIVRLRTGEIASDLAYYFAESEQIPTAMALGVYVEPTGAVSAAGGFLVQTLPPPDEGRIARLEERIGGLAPVTGMLRSGHTPETILAAIFGDIPYHVLEKKTLRLRCTCSRDRIERVVISLGPAEIAALIADPGEAVITCEFCRAVHRFSRPDLERLLAEMQS
ncbi:MAG TPA: Hsp33 family molecular chaperone HslO [Syntrophales bacterium]|jgi:molecular chaperone Hsp33|nr:Hsp33 family molecular chaperone HslO [Syntrophales bacterium]HON22874.1 Hsp33 family molecular chaperone HslO [Syntrophales bacterium]HOU78631.1 Hsp33 family molecular chaperone HslO [Syntrophales bacterium]HPC32625.1 Hsp33 family molecular chaperone HslO [Syntrophales bacterium]HQG34178.1 Hsp33 family molecular chaperone HslO [Syntrophales bacterium]